MRINYSRGEETDRISREIADGCGEVCQRQCIDMIKAGREPMQAAALCVAGLLQAVADGMATQYHMCHQEFSPEESQRLVQALEASVHKVQMELHAKVNGRMN